MRRLTTKRTNSQLIHTRNSPSQWGSNSFHKINEKSTDSKTESSFKGDQIYFGALLQKMDQKKVKLPICSPNQPKELKKKCQDPFKTQIMKELITLPNPNKDKPIDFYLKNGSTSTDNIRKRVLGSKKKRSARNVSMGHLPDYINNKNNTHESQDMFYKPRRKSFTINSESRTKPFSYLHFACNDIFNF